MNEKNTQPITIEIKPLSDNYITPTYASTEASGMDLYTCIDENIVLKPMERKLISTGFAMCLPKGYEAQIRPRSGLALKYGVTVLNTPGTIDSDYRGEVKVILINLGQESFTIEPKSRIAQMVINKIDQVNINEVSILETSLRGSGGFGSTGEK